MGAVGVWDGCGARVADHHPYRVLQIAQHIFGCGVDCPAEGVGRLVEALDDEVAAHLLDELGGGVAELAVHRGTGPHAQLTQSLLTEAVDGGDGGVVEGAHRVGQVLATLSHLVRPAVEQHLHPLEICRSGTGIYGIECLDESTSSAVTQFRGGGAGEGDEK